MNWSRLITGLLFLQLVFCSYAPGDTDRTLIEKSRWARVAKDYNFSEKKSPEPKPVKPKSASSPHFSFGGVWLKYVSFGLVILALLGLLLFLVLNIYKGVSEKVNGKITALRELTMDELEKLEDTDLQNILQQTLSSGLFKEAVRIRYIMLIRLLSKLAFVVWKKDKTNGTYVREMHGKEGADLFGQITLRFERVWYGEKDVNEREYLAIIPLFDEITKLVTPRE